MPHYNSMDQGGCGDKRCTNGWFYWHGSSYPCSDCEKIMLERAMADKRAEQKDEKH